MYPGSFLESFDFLLEINNGIKWIAWLTIFVPLGLMFTAGAVYHALHALNITIDIRNVCVLLAPWFASNTAIVTYFFTKEIHSKSAGLVRSEEHTSELQSLMRNSYAVFCLQKKNQHNNTLYA